MTDKVAAKKKANALLEKAGQMIDRNKTNKSESGAELITRANDVLYGAGLITGKLNK